MRVAVLGLGFMGSTHVKAWRQVPDARLVAVMSSDDRKLAGDLTSVQGNLGTSGERVDFSDLRKYTSIEAALADPQIDAIDVCLPTDLHAAAAIAALRAGKHVLVEKPLALSRADAQSVFDESKRCGRILMAGHVLRFIPAYADLRGRLPKSSPVQSAVFRRDCAAPAWGGWLTDPARSGGGVFDLLIHDADFCISLWGMPESVRATGEENLKNGVDMVHAALSYRDIGPVVITGGWHQDPSYPFSMQFSVETELGSFAWSSEESETGEPFAAELRYFSDCVNANRGPELCPPEESVQAVALMERILESRRHNGEPT